MSLAGLEPANLANARPRRSGAEVDMCACVRARARLYSGRERKQVGGCESDWTFRKLIVICVVSNKGTILHFVICRGLI